MCVSYDVHMKAYRSYGMRYAVRIAREGGWAGGHLGGQPPSIKIVVRLPAPVCPPPSCGLCARSQDVILRLMARERMSEKLAADIDRRVRSIVAEAYAVAKCVAIEPQFH